MGATQNKDGTLTFDVDYIGVWYEEQNKMHRQHLRELLDEGQHVHVDFQPGDGTRYEIHMFCPKTRSIVGNDRSPREAQRDGDELMVTINHLGSGISHFVRFPFLSGDDKIAVMDHIRYGIVEGMKIRNDNPCTIEALAATIYALWYMDD